MSERLRMTTQWPSHAYREDVLRRAYWLYIILGVVWVWIMAGRRWLGGNVAQRFEMGGISGFLLRNRYPDFTIEQQASLPNFRCAALGRLLAPLPPPFTRSRAKVQAERGRPPSAIPNSLGQVGRARIVRYLHPVCCIWTVSLSLCCRARTASDRPAKEQTSEP